MISKLLLAFKYSQMLRNSLHLTVFGHRIKILSENIDLICKGLITLVIMIYIIHVPLFTVDADEIKRLGKRFRKLDLDNSGALSVDEFMSLPELQQNPLVQRVIDIFDTDGNGEVDFKGTHLGLS